MNNQLPITLDMIKLSKRTIKDRIFRLWPAYRRKQDAETREAIKWLVEHPDAPCMIGDELILKGEIRLNQ